MTESEPEQIAALRSALVRLPGVREVGVRFVSLVGLDVDDLRFAPLGDLPAAALRRTSGGLPGESLVQVEIRLEPAQESWNTLEFLGWWVRDAARSGDSSQIRVRGLPPQVGDRIQVGTTLAFLIEWFVVHREGDLASLLSRVAAEAKNLSQAIDLYGQHVGAKGR
jgi:hypothetical protein